MLAITLNPGFVLILAAVIVLGTPATLRLPVKLAGAAAAMWLLLDQDFGAIAAEAQIGIPVVLLDLDALNQVFGIAFIVATILIAIYASARRSRYDDAAIMLLAGGAVSALFVGDLISFVAASSLAGLAAVWLVFASPLPEAGSVGVRMLVWHGLEGLLLLVGVAFHLSAGAANSVFERLNVEAIGGAFIFAALMIRVGAPMAHVWLKDAVSHASGAGGVAVSAFSTMLGVYALARFFPAEGLLVPIGAAMIVVGIFFAAAEDDLRRVGAYALTAHTGICIALIGIGSPLALAGASAHAFTAIFVFTLLQMALGAIADRTGTSRLSRAEGLAQVMPATCVFVLMGGLAAAGAPGFSLYISLAIAFEALGQWEHRALWTLTTVVSGALAACLAVRPALVMFRSRGKRHVFTEAPFPMLLAASLTAFLCVAIGLTPGWLYRLTPARELAFDPYVMDRLAPQMALIGAAGVAYILLRGLAPAERPVRILDADALYRGPIAGAGRWLGVVLLRLYGAARAALENLWDRAGRIFAAFARSCDRPYSDNWAGAAQFAAICAVLVIILLGRL